MVFQSHQSLKSFRPVKPGLDARSQSYPNLSALDKTTVRMDSTRSNSVTSHLFCEQNSSISNSNDWPYFTFPELMGHYKIVDKGSPNAKKIEFLIENQDVLGLNIESADPLCFFIVETKVGGYALIRIPNIEDVQNPDELSINDLSIHEVVEQGGKKLLNISLPTFSLQKKLKLSRFLVDFLNSVQKTVTEPIGLVVGNHLLKIPHDSNLSKEDSKRLKRVVKESVVQSIADPTNFLHLPIRDRDLIIDWLDNSAFKTLFYSLNNILNRASMHRLVPNDFSIENINITNELYQQLVEFFTPNGSSALLEAIVLFKFELAATVEDILNSNHSLREADQLHMIYIMLGVSFISMGSTTVFGVHDVSSGRNASVNFFRFLAAFCISQFIELRIKLPEEHPHHLIRNPHIVLNRRQFSEMFFLKRLALECVGSAKCAGEISVELDYLTGPLNMIRWTRRTTLALE